MGHGASTSSSNDAETAAAVRSAASSSASTSVEQPSQSVNSKRGSVSVSGSIASTGLDAAELAYEDIVQIVDVLPFLESTELGDRVKALSKQAEEGVGGERWRLPTVSTLKKIEATAATAIVRLAGEQAGGAEVLEGKSSQVDSAVLERFFQQNNHAASVGAQFFSVLDFTCTGELSYAELTRLDWRAFLKDQRVIQIKPVSAQEAQAQRAYDTALRLENGFVKYWNAGCSFLQPRASKANAKPPPFLRLEGKREPGSGDFLPHIGGWLRYFLIAGNVAPVSEGEGDFLSSETVSTAQESVEYVLRKDHANVELMAASLGVPPLLVFGPFEQLLEKATTASSAKPVPLPHHIGNTVDLQQYFGDMSNAIVTVVVGILVEYKANVIDGKSELLPDWAHHATKALLGTRPIEFTTWHVQLLQEVARGALNVIADDGEINIFNKRDLGKSLGHLGTGVSDVTVRLDDADTLGSVRHILEMHPSSAVERQQVQDSGITAEIYSILVVHFLNVAADVAFRPIAAAIASESGGSHSPAAPKTFSRMHVKAQGDYKDEPTPTVCANLDGARCGIIYESAQDFARGYAALENHPRLTPKRVKNNFDPAFDARTKTYGYRCLLCNALFQDASRTWQDVLRAAETELDDAAEQLADVYGDLFEAEALHVLSNLRRDAAFLRQPFAYVVEFQLLLDAYMDMRKKSHLLYKIVRADCGSSVRPLQEDFAKEAVLWKLSQ